MFEASHHLTSLTESVDGDTSIYKTSQYSVVNDMLIQVGAAMSWIASKVVQFIISCIIASMSK